MVTANHEKLFPYMVASQYTTDPIEGGLVASCIGGVSFPRLPGSTAELPARMVC
jgi:hypothetical protein